MSERDIVARLRESDGGYFMRQMFTEAADEIERLRKEAFSLAANQCHAGYGGEYGHHRCREIDRLTAERDEARREVCEADTDTHGGALLEAERRGWNCFKEDTDDR